MGARRSRVVGATIAAAVALSVGAVTASAGDNPQAVDFVHNVVNAPAPVAGAVFGLAQATTSGKAICTTATQTAANVNTDCETVTAGPHNETSIAINPTNTQNILGGANDYQLALNSGGHLTESILSRAHVSFDGGKTWSEYPIQSNSAYQATGDPSVAFDAAGHAYYATLGFRFVGPTNATNPDVVVANSGDGGKTWTAKRIAAGSGNEGSVGDLLDKEYVTAWGNGNALVVFGDFRLGQKGSVISSRIMSSVTHDSGATWSAPRVISGSLDQAFVATPTVASNGHVFVSFLNTTDLTTGRNDYEVVQVSPSTGARLAGPVKVATVIDGFNDYPVALGRQTYQDSVFRSWAAGNITADPTSPNHLAVVWSDMRNSPAPAANLDPYASVTNSDVVVSESTDGGQTWSAPAALPLAGDQWMPWGAFDASGTLRIGTLDRRYDAANHRYGYSLASVTGVSPLSFRVKQVTTTLSDPTTGDRWFARTVNAGFPSATAFLGDYSNIAAMPGGRIAAYWTDMRNSATFGGSTGHGEDAFFATVATP